MQRRSLISIVGAAALGGCAATMPGSTDWEYRFEVVEQPTSTAEGVGARVTTADPHATTETPAELEIVVSNRRDTPLSVGVPAWGFVQHEPTNETESYLYPPSIDLEHEGDGVWAPVSPDSLPDGYVSSLSFERLPTGETLETRNRIGVSPDAGEAAYSTGRVEFGGQRLELFDSEGFVDPSFTLAVERGR